MPYYTQTPVSIPVAALNLGDGYGVFTLRFGVQAPVCDEQGVPVGDGVQWTHQALLSPTSALQLRDMLDAAIKAWEARFGAIPAMSVSFTKNGEAPVAEIAEKECPACGGKGSVADIGVYELRTCTACEGSGKIETAPRAVTVLDLFRNKPPAPGS